MEDEEDCPAFWAGVDEDLIEAFSPDGGPVQATYAPKGADPVTIPVVWRRTRGITDARAPGLPRPERVGGFSYVAKGPRHVLAGAREGETLAVKGRTYSISGVNAEGVGLVTLRLQGPLP